MGKVKAAHALAKIAAVSNPDIAFPGERVGARCWGGWDGAMGRVSVFLGAFPLVTLPLAWEGAWCHPREGSKLEVPGLQAWLCL